MRSVIELLHEGSRIWSDMPYLGEKNGETWATTSFLQTDRISLSFAASLVIRGIKKGDAVAILSEGRTSWVIAEFGVLKAGGIPVPVTQTLAPRQIARRLELSGAKAVLVSERYLRKISGAMSLRGARLPVVCISGKSAEAREALAMCGFTEGKDAWFLSDMIVEGQHGLDTRPIAAGNAFGGKPLIWVMREIEKDLREGDTATLFIDPDEEDNPEVIAVTHSEYLECGLTACKTGGAARASRIALNDGWKTPILFPLETPFAHSAAIYACLALGTAMHFLPLTEGETPNLHDISRHLRSLKPEYILLSAGIAEGFRADIERKIGGKGKLARAIFAKGLNRGIERMGDGKSRVPFGTRLGCYFPWKTANALSFPGIRASFGKNAHCILTGNGLGDYECRFFGAIGIPVKKNFALDRKFAKAPVAETDVLTPERENARL